MKKLATAAVGFVLLTLASACDSGSDGYAVPASTSKSGAAASSSEMPDLAQRDPCSFLTETQKKQLMVKDVERDVVLGAPQCRISLDIPNDVAVVSIDVQPDRGLDQFDPALGKPTKTTISGRNALEQRSAAGNCVYAMEISSTSRVDIQGPDTSDMDASCDSAMRLAMMVERNLP